MKTKLLILLLLTSLTTGCITPEQPDDQISDDRISVIVSIPPQKEFVESIGKEKVSVSVMIPPGASPVTYEPGPGQLRGFSRAELYVRIGHIPFEKAWMDEIAAANPDMEILDSSEDIEIIENDPHIWLSPALVRLQVEHIAGSLIEIDPDNKDYYIRNKESYLKDLNDLDADIRKNLSGIHNRKFMIFHPAWGYFAREYRLEQIPIEVEGKEPSAADLARLVDTAKANNITIVFAAPQFNPESARVIAEEIGGTVISIDPLAEDCAANMRAVSGILSRYMAS
ncbi:MAG: zinc ABC transporter substrate-binding protein [Methanosarcinales archaeon]|nr:MAG: zinc ABC transporter substrate-binding protein [Methanosarcinales archaeon]